MEPVEFCPKCGVRAERGNFCRACGTNLVSISEALAGADAQPRSGPQSSSGSTLGIFNEVSVSNSGRDINRHNAAAVFGTVDMDLTRAPLRAGETKISGVAVFGGLNVLVPYDVGVRITGISIMAAVKCGDEKVRGGIFDAGEYRTGNYSRAARRLHIDLVTIFGEVKIKR